MKHELVAKGALASWSIPKEYKDEAIKKKPLLLFSKEQQQRFSMPQLLTGAWFLECQGYEVHKEEKHLVDTARSSGAASATVDTDNDDDFSTLPGAPPAPVEPPAPAAQPKGKGSRKRSKNAPVPEPEVEPESEEEADGDAPLLEENIVRGEPALTQTSHGTVVNARVGGGGISQASQRTAAIGGRREPGLTQASEGGVFNVGSPPRSSNINHNSAKSPLRPKHSKHGIRPLPVPKHVNSSSSSGNPVTLPMYLEMGDIGHLVRQSTTNGVWEEQILDIISHIEKV